MDLKNSIRTIPDYPKPGIMFRDVTSLIEDGAAFAASIDQLQERFSTGKIDKIAGIEARGFIFGAALAKQMGVGFVAIRKPGKLPRATISESYELEYGTDELHLHTDAVAKGEHVLLIDDLIATGGTAMAGLALLRRAGANVSHAGFVIDLPDLGGAEKLRAEGLTVECLVEFGGH